jgi:hypothetical protein
VSASTAAPEPTRLRKIKASATDWAGVFTGTVSPSMKRSSMPVAWLLVETWWASSGG